MRIHHEGFERMAKFLEEQKNIDNSEQIKLHVDQYLSIIHKFKTLDPETEILEVGSGTGWFTTFCNMRGLSCRGIDISKQFIDYARKYSQKLGVEPRFQLANIEDTDLGTEKYDIVIAFSVFEHVEFWKQGLDNIWKALKPGGILYFSSTNKFSFRSGEYHLPLYGWMPNFLRYSIRKRV